MSKMCSTAYPMKTFWNPWHRFLC